jgi:alkaline phosphatase
MENVYVIRKIMTDKKGRVINVLLTNGHSEIMEFNKKNKAEEMAALLNENSDSGWSYVVIGIIKE